MTEASRDRALAGAFLLAAAGGAVLLLLPPGLLVPRMEAYALARSPDGVVSPEGIRQMLLTVRLAGWTFLVMGLVGGMVGLRVARLPPDEPFAVDPAPGSEAGRPDGLLLVALGVLSAGLRAPRLTHSLGYDEIFTALRSVEPGAPWRPLLDYGITLNNHPFYSFLAGVSSALLGAESELALRLPAFLAGVAAPLVLFAVARRLGGRLTGTAAGLLLALSPLAVEYSAQARGYSLLILFVSLSLLLLLRALERPSRRRWWAWAAVSVLGVWTHLFMVVVVVGQLTGLLLAGLAGSRPGGAALARTAFRAGAAVTAGALACYAASLHEVFFAVVDFTLVERAIPRGGAEEGPGLGFLAWLSGSHWPGAEGRRPLAWAFGCAVAAGVVEAFRRLRLPVFLPLVVPLLLVAPALLGLGAVDFQRFRFFLWALPLALLFAAMGVGAAGAWRGGLGVGALVVVVLPALQGLEAYLSAPEPPIREFAALVRGEVGPDDCLMTGWAVGGVLPYYYPGDFSTRWDGSAGCDPRPGGRMLYACQYCLALEGGDSAPWDPILLHQAGGGVWTPPYQLYRISPTDEAPTAAPDPDPRGTTGG